MSDFSIKLTSTGPVTLSKSGAFEASTAKVSGSKSKDEKSSTTLEANAGANIDKFAKVVERFIPAQLPNTRLAIEHDEGTGLFVYKSVDQTSGETVRQYPVDEVLRFISYYREREGLIVDGSV